MIFFFFRGTPALAVISRTAWIFSSFFWAEACPAITIVAIVPTKKPKNVSYSRCTTSAVSFSVSVNAISGTKSESVYTYAETYLDQIPTLSPHSSRCTQLRTSVLSARISSSEQ